MIVRTCREDTQLRPTLAARPLDVASPLPPVLLLRRSTTRGAAIGEAMMLQSPQYRVYQVYMYVHVYVLEYHGSILVPQVPWYSSTIVLYRVC